MKTDCVIILTTTDSEGESEKLAQVLLKEKLAACVRIQRIKSHYWWNKKIECANEYLLMIKTRASLFAEISELIRKNHSYETPEIVQIPITDGSQKYLEWIGSVMEQSETLNNLVGKKSRGNS
ncbi:MAG: divalent-cation tolerance protein CutA [Holosporaceae bacterium]|jgi:periplasmic divalent cation tolerance protein|nr:divalent-cation tolerance protein CutA [Holosporaceae bacterium]